MLLAWDGGDCNIMKVLVTSAAYPTNDGKRPQYFVHSRNLYYQKNGIEVTVLNFATEDQYSVDGIRVFGMKHFDPLKEKYDLLICHAANLRNHYAFLKKYDSFFSKIVFVFHGHEILHINKYYPFIKCVENYYKELERNELGV